MAIKIQPILGLWSRSGQLLKEFLDRCSCYINKITRYIIGENHWTHQFQQAIINLDTRWRSLGTVVVQWKVLHWNVHADKYILSMDIVEEKSVATRLPDLGLRMMTKWRYRLQELDGCFAVVYYDSIAIFSIWVLIDQRDYIKKENIKFADRGVIAVLPPLKLVPIGGMENGRYLVFKHDETDDDGRLYFYINDMNTMEMKNRYKINKEMKNMEHFFTYRSNLYNWNTFKDDQVKSK